MIPVQSSQEKQKGGSGTVKLRDSCDACATSKLKCPKERPTCSRCAKRNISCTYVQSKRKGRKSQSSQSTASTSSRSSDTNIASRHPSVSGSNFPAAAASTFPPVPTPNVAPMASPTNQAPTAPMAASAPSAMTSFSPAMGAQSLFPGDSSMFMDDFLAPLREPWSSVGSVSGDSNTYSANTLFSAGPSELFGKYGDGSVPQISDSLDADTWSWALSQDTDMSFTDLINCGKDNIDSPIGPIHFFGSSNPESAVASSASSINQIAASNGTEIASREDHAPESCCMLRAMSFMKQIGTKSRAGSQDSTAMDLYGAPSTSESVNTNTRALEVVREILDCSCGSHGHIQVLVSLIILRLLDDYATEARRDSSTQSLAGSAVSEPFEEASPTHVAARRVLGQLHCVQGLIAQLSSKIHETKAKSDAAATAQAAKPGQQEANGMMFFFSARTLDQIEMDVRGRLKTLSKKLIAVLREE